MGFLLDANFWSTVVAVVGGAVGVGSYFNQRHESLRTARLDHVQFLHERVEDLQRSLEICEARCQEQNEQVQELMRRLILGQTVDKTRRRK